jgi:hypothetical protein
MKLPEIKSLLVHDIQELKNAEEALLNEEVPAIEVPGIDEGEQMTHIYAAIWIKEKMDEGMNDREALRAYTQRVRNSIS